MKPNTKGPIEVKRSIVYIAEQYQPFCLPVGVRENRKVKRTGPAPDDITVKVLDAMILDMAISPGDWVLRPVGFDPNACQSAFETDGIRVVSDLQFQRDYEPA